MTISHIGQMNDITHETDHDLPVDNLSDDVANLDILDPTFVVMR